MRKSLFVIFTLFALGMTAGCGKEKKLSEEECTKMMRHSIFIKGAEFGDLAAAPKDIQEKAIDEGMKGIDMTEGQKQCQLMSRKQYDCIMAAQNNAAFRKCIYDE